MQREYIFKCPRWRERILGVSVVDNSKDMDESKQEGLQRSCRIYILTSDARIHVLEISRRGSVRPNSIHSEVVTRKVKVKIEDPVTKEQKTVTHKQYRKKHISEQTILSVNDLLY